MDTKIIALIAGSFLLTGCVTAKVERLNATTKQLSTDVDSYVAMVNRILDQYEKKQIEANKDDIEAYLKTDPRYLEGNKEFTDDIEKFNVIFKRRHQSHFVNETMKQQNKYLSEYFKILPSLLEEKDIGDSVQGLVTNIDILNQVKEKNLTIADEYKGRLKPNEASLIESVLTNSFKIHQYQTFKNAVNNHYDVILTSLVGQKNDIHIANTLIFRGLNQQFIDSQMILAESFKNQHTETLKLKKDIGGQVNYNDNDFKKFNEMTQLPFVLVRADITEKPAEVDNSYRSAAYLQYCTNKDLVEPKQLPKEIPEGMNKTNKIESFVLTSTDGKTIEKRKYKFDTQTLAVIKGDIAVCELIDIIGLLKEKKYNQVESTTLKRSVDNYNKILDLVDKKAETK
jgi:outer membrane murein-binding lipoprotein Lpp/environmental stress-induced protein Ves